MPLPYFGLFTHSILCCFSLFISSDGLEKNFKKKKRKKEKKKREREMSEIIENNVSFFIFIFIFKCVPRAQNATGCAAARSSSGPSTFLLLLSCCFCRL